VDERLKRIRESEKKSHKLRVLDLGCGVGRNQWFRNSSMIFPENGESVL